jgi:hypothetical protein
LNVNESANPPSSCLFSMATKFLKWTTLSSSLALGAWTAIILHRVYHVKPASIILDYNSNASFLNSQTCSAVVNPRRYKALSDTRSILLRLPSSRRQYSDEQILATFVKGFFGGWVFAPEGILLRAFQRTLVDFSGMCS